MNINPLGISRIRCGVDTSPYYNEDFALEMIQLYGKKKLYETFVIDEHNKEFFKQLIYYFQADIPKFKPDKKQGDVNKGLLIIGAPGVGKTDAMEIMNHYRNRDELSFFSAGVKKRLRFDIDRSRDIVYNFMNHGWDGIAGTLRNKPVICIDDVGEEQDAVYYGNTINIIQELIEYRNKRPVITFLITNLHANELKAKYGDRALSRMLEMFNFITLKGPDRRKKP